MCRTLRKDRMLLYKHAARCSSAMQIFLNFNPIYGRFIPVSINQAAQHDRNYRLPSSLVLLDSINPTSIASKDRQAISRTSESRSDEATRSNMRRLPDVPAGYTFSTFQRALQFQYFKNKLDVKSKQNEYIDLFNATIIAVCKYRVVNDIHRFRNFLLSSTTRCFGSCSTIR